jgi:hypothetical protein
VSAPSWLRNRALAWGLVMACTVGIWTLSSDEFSSESTGRFLFPLLRWLFPELSIGAVYELHHFVRKAAHFSEYALLGLLAFRAIALTLSSTALRIAASAVLFACAVSAIDETRQSFSLARTGSIWDVALDVLGAATAVLLLVLLKRGLGGSRDSRGALGAER